MITNYPNKVELKDLTFVEDPKGGYTAWITDFPAVVDEGDTQEEVLEKINLYLQQIKILR